MSNRIHIPLVFGNASSSPGSTMPPEAAEFMRLWLIAIGQRARIVRRDDRLTRAAQKHADFLPTRTPEQMQQSGHIGQGGSTPNERVRAEGIVLPDHYLKVGNNVESYRRTHKGAEDALAGLLASPEHREHVMGINWFADHVLFGVGYRGGYYVFVSTPIS